MAYAAEAGGVRRPRLVFQPEGYGQFVTQVAMSADGRLVMLRGGAQAAPLAGAGGDCLYERRGDGGYTVLGCNMGWVS